MRLNSLSLLVTRLTPQDMACAPMSMSMFTEPRLELDQGGPFLSE